MFNYILIGKTKLASFMNKN